MRAERSAGGPDAPITEFLRRARNRNRTRVLLEAAFVSAAADILLELALQWVNRILNRDLPRISIGIVLFLLLGGVAFRRSRIGLVAARVDRRLRLQDRLVTFLDFRGREDVDPAFRAAQAGETAAAIARADLVRGVPVPRLLWAAPLLFGWMLYLEHFQFLVPFFQPTYTEVTLRTDPRQVVVRLGSAPEGDAARPPHPEEPSQPEPQPQSPAQPKREDPPADGTGTPPADSPAVDGMRSAEAGQPGSSPPKAGGIPAAISEPAQLFSEPVSAGLTPVAADAPGAARGTPLALRGRISFNLVPVDGGADGPPGTGGRPGGGKAEGLAITVDYDAVPPEYRLNVRRYFEALVRLFQGGNDGT